MFEFTDKKSAVALVKYERDRSKVVYADYIAANDVTLDNVSEHVAALQALAFPDFDPKTADDEAKYVRKTFGNRVRNGLNHTLGKRPEQKDPKEDPENGQEDPENGQEDPENGQEDQTPTATVAISDMSTSGLSSFAEDIVRELVTRSMGGDAMATESLRDLSRALITATAPATDAGWIAA